MIITETRTPWINNLGDVPATLDYFRAAAPFDQEDNTAVVKVRFPDRTGG